MTIEPIRISDIVVMSATATSRTEAERQFRFSFALVIIFVVGTLVAVGTLPISGSDGGYGTRTASPSMQLAEN
jgi:hypothetical protein